MFRTFYDGILNFIENISWKRVSIFGVADSVIFYFEMKAGVTCEASKFSIALTMKKRAITSCC